MRPSPSGPRRSASLSARCCSVSPPGASRPSSQPRAETSSDLAWRPPALGFITLFFSIGQAAGPSVAGAMADRSGTFASAYLLAGAVALGGAAGASLLRPAAPPLERRVQRTVERAAET